jgi:large subunit ribosomal protein L6
MSRIGKLPVPVPSGVTVDVAGNKVTVKGPKGSLEHFVPEHVAVKMDSGRVLVERSADHRQARANHGLMRAMVRNMVHGVTQGFEKRLEIAGVGYRAELRGQNLVLNLGYSHPIDYTIPKGISLSIDKPTPGTEKSGMAPATAVIAVKGIDRHQVGQVAADIRAFRKPDSYKGKGLRYVGEHINLKAGKSAK